eukprot:jgi/Chrzof1/7726/Cz02g34120.t1
MLSKHQHHIRQHPGHIGYYVTHPAAGGWAADKLALTAGTPGETVVMLDVMLADGAVAVMFGDMVAAGVVMAAGAVVTGADMLAGAAAAGTAMATTGTAAAVVVAEHPSEKAAPGAQHTSWL